MKLDEALNLIKGVCANFRGTLQDHQALQQAIQVVENKCTEKKCKKDKKETVAE